MIVIFDGKNYDRDLGDTLKLQGEVAEAIVRQIKINLTNQEQTTFQQQRHVIPRAFEAYAEGMYFGSRVSRDSLDKSVALLTQAIELDPDYVQGDAALPHSYHVMGMLRLRPAGELIPKPRPPPKKLWP